MTTSMTTPMTRFSTVVIDPPWMETGGGKIRRGADRHYDLLRSEDIPSVVMGCPYWNDVASSAHLYLWATNNFLPDALQVMSQLGFTYKTNVVWVKQRIGLGQYFRGRHELCLFGVRGDAYSVRTSDRTIASVVQADRGIHSKKPEEFMRMVQRRSQGPYLELFARSPRPGWVTWGDEVPAAPIESEASR
jgi:N6-adenosine-specific RNA methylase IME4